MEDNVRKRMYICVTGSLCCVVENWQNTVNQLWWKKIKIIKKKKKKHFPILNFPTQLQGRALAWNSYLSSFRYENTVLFSWGRENHMHHSYHHHLHSSLLNPNWPCKGTACLHPKRSQLLEIRGENNVCVKTAVFKIGTWSPHPHLCPVRRWGRNRIKLSHQWLVHVVTKVAVGKAMLQPRMPFFFGHLTAYGIPGPGVRSELQLWPAGVAMLDPLTHRAGPGMQPVSWCCRDATDAVVPWQELREVLIFNSDK